MQQVKNNVLKEWGLQQLHMMKYKYLGETYAQQFDQKTFKQKDYILKLPLQFTYPPVEILSKQLTKLNSKYKQRIVYLGPRWADSVMWHRKFSKSKHEVKNIDQNFQNHQNFDNYYFNQRRVLRNNSFIQDSMKQNRFFKNEIYYRAFEGMNPTLNDKEEIIFQSRFQSGNLDCVVKIDDKEYDLFLRIDTNTRGNIFWYYFKMHLSQQCKQKKKIKINICNITKSKTLYQKNLKPYVMRKTHNKENKIFTQTWTQGDGVQKCSIKQKKLRYPFIYEKVKPHALYQLSFQIEIKPGEQISLAYCIPYKYSDLMSSLIKLQKQVQQKNIINVHISKLCQSLTGVEVPIIVIGDTDISQKIQQKKVIFITGRIHPGESNSSIILSSLINQLCLGRLENILTNRVIFVIIPMLNPDGVILGNGRTSALGKDLNRQFKTQNPHLNPQIVAIKQLVQKIQETHQIQMYFDFHSHSKKKNVFFFGPQYSVTDPNYYRCRIFPKIFSKNLQFFRYFGCNYTISQNKKTTARAVMINQFNISFFYTVQTSVGLFYDYAKRQDVSFTVQSLSTIAYEFKQSLQEYFEGIQEYQEYLKQKKKVKNIQKFDMLNSKNQNNDSKNFNQDIKLTNLKYVKIFQEIKSQGKIAQKQSNESDSDSCRASEQLEDAKMKEFQQMLIKVNKIQQQKNNDNVTLPVKFSLRDELSERKNKNKLKNRYSLIQNQFFNLLKTLPVNNQFKVHINNFNIHSRLRSKSFGKKLQTLDLQLKNSSYNPSTNSRLSESRQQKLNSLNISAHNFFRKIEEDIEIDKQSQQKMKIVDFSKMIQNPKSLRYSQNGNKQIRSHTKKGKRKKIVSHQQFEGIKSNTSNKIKFFQPFTQNKHDLQDIVNQNANNAANNSLNSSKPYPASFYRIKYQSSHRKYRQKSSSIDTSFYNFKRTIEQQNRKTSGKHQDFKNNKTQKISSEPQKLFINISKIQK